MPCLVRVTRVEKADRPDRGLIEVEYVGPAPFRIEGVYIDPVAGKKLQVLLESGLNILLDGPQGCGKTVLARSIATSLGMTAGWLQELVDCAVSRAGDASDPLAVPGIKARAANAGDGFVIEIEAPTRQDADEVLRRAQALRG